MINTGQNFIASTEKLRTRVEIVLETRSTNPLWKHNYLLSGILSDLWQGWCNFCRSIVIGSCRGCVTRSGGRILPRTAVNTPERVAYEAKRYMQNNAPSSTGAVTYLRQEPTWGDTNRLPLAIAGIAPNNSMQLLGGFGAHANGPKHLQLTRNSIAHLNSETMAEVRLASLSYIFSQPIGNPVDLVLATDQVTGSLAIFSWMDDLELIADIVTA